MRCHDLRQVHVSILLAKGVDPKTIQERIGQASISMLLNFYAHAFPVSQERIVDIISEEIKLSAGKMPVKNQKNTPGN